MEDAQEDAPWQIPAGDIPEIDSSESGSLKLRDLDFTDLYISVQGACKLRGLGGSGALAAPPEGLREDLRRFASLVGASSSNRREFSIVYDNIFFRVSRIDSVNGVWYAARRSPDKVPALHDLSFPHKLVEAILGLGQKEGLIILSGATGQGKTTTASAMVRSFLERHGDIAVTVEDPPELPLDGAVGEHGWCFQTEVHNGNFGDALVRSLRYQPRIIMIGEVRTVEAAKHMIRASVNGHLVITTIHAGSVLETIGSLMMLVDGSDREYMRHILAEGLLLAMNQRLEGSPRKPKIEVLMPGHFNDFVAVRSKIRSGRFEQLASEIQAHTNHFLKRS